MLQVSNVTVLNWIREFAEQVEPIRSPESMVETVEIDELCTYLHEKKTSSGSGWLLIATGTGSSVLWSGHELPLLEKSSGSTSEGTVGSKG